MNIYTNGREIELKMINKALEECTDNVSMSVVVNNKNIEEIVVYLQHEYICNVEFMNEMSCILTLEWERG